MNQLPPPKPPAPRLPWVHRRSTNHAAWAVAGTGVLFVLGVLVATIFG